MHSGDTSPAAPSGLLGRLTADLRLGAPAVDIAFRPRTRRLGPALGPRVRTSPPLHRLPRPRGGPAEHCRRRSAKSGSPASVDTVWLAHGLGCSALHARGQRGRIRVDRGPRGSIGRRGGRAAPPWRGNSGGYGGRVRGMHSILQPGPDGPGDQVSTKSGGAPVLLLLEGFQPAAGTFGSRVVAFNLTSA